MNPAVLGTRRRCPCTCGRAQRHRLGGVDRRRRASRRAADPILTDPNEAYRTEVIAGAEGRDARRTAARSASAPNEWLTIAAKGNDDRPRLAPADSDARTRIIRLRGSDLAAFLARQITREEALKRIEVRVF